MARFSIRIVTAIGVFLLFAFFMYSIYIPANGSLSGKWKITMNGRTFTRVVPFDVTVKNPTYVIATKEFSSPNVDTLVIPGIDGGGCEVYINDHLIYQNGDMKKGTANIWNKVHVISFDPKILRKHNVIKIRFYALYNAGITFIPYMGKYDNLRLKILFVKFFKYNIIFVMMGMMLSLALILFTLSALDKENHTKYFMIAMAAVFMIVYLIDLTGWDARDVFHYLLIRKISLVSLYMSIYLFFDGMERELFNSLKFSKLFLFLTLASSFYTLIQRTPYSFKSSLLFGQFTITLMLATLLVEVYYRKAIKLVYPVTLVNLLMGLYAVLEMVNMKLSFGPMIVTYSTTTIIGSIGIMLTENYHRNYSTMIVSHKRALTDPLTRVFNRGLLNELSLSAQDVIVMIDMDNFKRVNDTYGHNTGDKVLKLFCNISEKNLRKGDFIVRYGGDEFLLILENCTKKDAISIAERIRKSFEEEAKEYKVTFSYGAERVEKDLTTAIKKADAKMYSMKDQRKPKKVLK